MTWPKEQECAKGLTARTVSSVKCTPNVFLFLFSCFRKSRKSVDDRESTHSFGWVHGAKGCAASKGILVLP